ncbi:MAG: hypothetical protein HS117_03320 [Verrucomicrobiaceae bacterium]|jgi:hypothetical protein|nr:hypothetical protein [Verrucomicrobiaceae bacterium]
MKTSIRFFLCVLLALQTIDAREFTDLQGRKIEAEIISATATQATLKRAADNRLINVPVTAFSDADQKFIQDFALANQKYSFEVAYTKKKLDAAKQRSGPETFITERWAYRIDLKNRVPADLADLRVDYWLFMKGDEGKGKGSARVQSSGSQKLALVKGSTTTSFETSPIELSKTKLDGGYYYTDGSRQNYGDAVGGIAIRVFDKNDKEVFKYATKDDLFAAAVGRPKAGGSNSASTSSPK